MPECSCYAADAVAAENLNYDVAWAAAHSAELAATLNGICKEAYPYYVNTVVVMLLRSVAIHTKGKRKEDERFLEILETLVGDVKMRDDVLNALLERNREGRTNQ
jgi:hypothetical protein